jgi:hypothetical protein
MVSFEESRLARGEWWPFEIVFERTVWVAALVRFVVVSRVRDLGAGSTADGAIVRESEELG